MVRRLCIMYSILYNISMHAYMHMPQQTCGEQISDEERFIESNKKRVWHATSECCFCIICKSPLCGKRYLTTDNRLLCSKKHFDLYKSYLKDAPSKHTYSNN